MNHVCAVIGDIVESRKSPDRSALQGHLERALDEANRTTHPLEPLRPTVGDEFQGVFRTLGDAIRATGALQSYFVGLVDCRFGVGLGTRAPVESSFSDLEDGTAWWSAREAIVEVKSRETKGSRYLRTWYSTRTPEAPAAELVNAFLVTRDQLVSQLDARGRRILSRALAGDTQQRIAERESITQSAVSQTMARKGINAILLGAELIAEVR